MTSDNSNFEGGDLNDDKYPQEANEEQAFTAANIQIKIASAVDVFHPVFIHQCFSGEVIRGYKPAAAARPSSTGNENGQIDLVDNELLIRIELAPSSTRCRLIVDSKMEPYKKRPSIADATGTTARRKRQCLSGLSANEQQPQTGDNSESNRLPEEMKQQQPVLTLSEIRDSLIKALPDVVEENSSALSGRYLHEPVGSVIEEYSTDTPGQDFCLSLATGAEASTYHSQVQRLALFFIETASDVNVADTSDGCWHVLYLFQKHKDQSGKDGNSICKYSFVGYMTLYSFAAPFHKPRPGTILRICQALVLPPYQRSGHGRKMLQAVHRFAEDRLTDKMNNEPPIVQVNVEDPAPAFQALRTAVDYECFLKSGWFQDGKNDNINMKADDQNCFVPLAEAQALSVASLAKITTEQVRVVYEIHKLKVLEDHLEMTDDLSGSSSGELQKKYRLMVKKRLKSKMIEELATCHNKAEMQEMLSEAYENVAKQYQTVLARVAKRSHAVP